MKALLQELGLHIPKTHDLEELQSLLSNSYPELRSLRRGLEFLGDFAVDVRYPRMFAKKRQAEAAFRWGKRVRQVARALLRLPAAPKRPKRW